jgi:hypothetical protein
MFPAENPAAKVPNVPSAAPNGSAQWVSQSESNAFRARLDRFWKNPGIPLKVTVRVRLNRDRRLAAPPEVVSSGTSPQYQAAAQSAVQALMQGQPYEMFRGETFDRWKYMDVDFVSKPVAAPAQAQTLAQTEPHFKHMPDLHFVCEQKYPMGHKAYVNKFWIQPRNMVVIRTFNDGSTKSLPITKSMVLRDTSTPNQFGHVDYNNPQWFIGMVRFGDGLTFSYYSPVMRAPVRPDTPKVYADGQYDCLEDLGWEEPEQPKPRGLCAVE